MKNAKIVAKPKYGPNLGPPKTNKSLGDYSGLYGRPREKTPLSEACSPFGRSRPRPS